VAPVVFLEEAQVCLVDGGTGKVLVGIGSVSGRILSLSAQSESTMREEGEAMVNKVVVKEVLNEGLDNGASSGKDADTSDTSMQTGSLEHKEDAEGDIV
jgi:hypothetical protein